MGALFARLDGGHSTLPGHGKKVAADGFTPDNAGLSPFMQRLARAHANCIEGLPIFGGLLAIAIMTSRTAITDPLAFWFLGARILQSIIHLVSTSSKAVSLRFAAFAAQMAIGVYWSWKLLACADSNTRSILRRGLKRGMSLKADGAIPPRYFPLSESLTNSVPNRLGTHPSLASIRAPEERLFC
jgi:uncharacterized MAPEG superfamily protein